MVQEDSTSRKASAPHFREHDSWEGTEGDWGKKSKRWLRKKVERPEEGGTPVTQASELPHYPTSRWRKSREAARQWQIRASSGSY